ncbi:MAG: SusD/RagB family nutrient-binding outer membrane lipoprotein [Mucilaginibacter sp.]
MKKYLLILAIAFAAGSSGCKKDYLSLEVNPNQPSVTTPQLTLSGALTSTSKIMVNDYFIYHIWSGYLSWNGGVVPPAQIFQYQFSNGDFSPTIWNDLYVNATNFNNLVNLSAKDPSLGNFQAIGMIMKAWAFQQLVDNFNDVPYSQAFQPSTILFPAYDKGPAIYADLGKQLDNAVALISKSTGGVNPGNSDVVFKGDMAKWSQFANTLHLRLALRESNVESNPLKTNLPSAGTAYLATDALLNPGYANTAGQQNPFYAFQVKDANGNPAGNSLIVRANAFSVDYLQNTNDPRLGRIFSLTLQPPPPGAPDTSTKQIYRGNVYGDGVNIQGTKHTSGAGPAYSLGPNQSSIVMLAAESYFLQAEAVQRGWISGDPAALYNQGVTSSFEYLGLTAADASNYLSNPANAYPASANSQIQAIITQKWIAFLNGYDSLEAFSEYRRTGYPALPSSVDPGAISSHLPNRLYYPDSEVSANPVAYKADGGDLINPFVSKIFWAK